MRINSYLKLPCWVMIVALTLSCCERYDDEIEIPIFDFNTSVNFDDRLSSYTIFQGDPANLKPSDKFQLLELSSVLFTDYAYKQRLISVPEGTQLSADQNFNLDFPDGTVLVKTFYYQHDERDASKGKRIIESRLLIKENGVWNAATYQWDDSQTEAYLITDGFQLDVSWTDLSGKNLSTRYQIPSENDCKVCHQKNQTLIPLGTNLRNLNRTVVRNNESINQLTHLQLTSILAEIDPRSLPEIVNYQDTSLPLANRARAYLEMNCAHCHNPDAWEGAARREFDFRYETSLENTGIYYEEEKIARAISDGEMPFIGTTMLDQEGVALILNFLEDL